MPILLVALESEHNRIVLDALSEFASLQCLSAYSKPAATLQDALNGYKAAIMQELPVVVRLREAF